MEQYLAEHHLSPTTEEQAPLSPIDGRLLEHGLKRRIGVTVPEYAIIPYVLAGTDLVFTTGRPFAEHLAQMMPFSVLQAPQEFVSMDFYLLWHDCKHHSDAHAWLRQIMRKVAAQLRSTDILSAGNGRMWMPDAPQASLN
jgi:DNA-binding transcriptional LysR family regulator